LTCTQDGAGFGEACLEGGQVGHGAVEVLGLWEDGVLELRLVGDKGIHGGDAANRGVEIVEELIADTRGDLGSIAPGEHVLVRDDDARGLADALGDGLPVVGGEAAEVDDFGVDAGLAVELLRGLEGAGNDGAVGDKGEVLAGTDDLGFAERDAVLGAGIDGAAEGFAVEPLVLEEDDRIVAADGRTMRTPGVWVKMLSPDCEW